MTEAEIKAQLSKAARRCWPNAAKASDLPFPGYWKAVTEWLAFQAPHIGDKLLASFIDGFVAGAKEAAESGQKPAAPKVSDEVREIWRRAAAQAAKNAWEHAAERADAVRSRFAGRENAVQGRLL